MNLSQGMLERILAPVSRCLTPEAARKLVEARADSAAQRRIDKLADKSTEGELTPAERAEYEAYVAAGTVIAILQAHARQVLASNESKSGKNGTLDQRLLAAGLISRIPPPIDLGSYKRSEPVRVEGKPISESIIEERR